MSVSNRKTKDAPIFLGTTLSKNITKERPPLLGGTFLGHC
jgi:hypothetical protein